MRGNEVKEEQAVSTLEISQWSTFNAPWVDWHHWHLSFSSFLPYSDCTKWISRAGSTQLWIKSNSRLNESFISFHACLSLCMHAHTHTHRELVFWSPLFWPHTMKKWRQRLY